MKIERTCTECDKPFLTEQRGLKRGRGKFCSMACRFASQKRLTGENSPSWKGGKSVDADGYPMTLMPEHPRARQNGYVLDHILEAEKIGSPNLSVD